MNIFGNIKIGIRKTGQWINTSMKFIVRTHYSISIRSPVVMIHIDMDCWKISPVSRYEFRWDYTNLQTHQEVCKCRVKCTAKCLSKPQVCRECNCWSLRCSWSIACRRCSNNIFILDLTPCFNELGRDNSKTIQESCKFWDKLRLILEILRYDRFSDVDFQDFFMAVAIWPSYKCCRRPLNDITTW